jgi:hypothetical protein
LCRNLGAVGFVTCAPGFSVFIWHWFSGEKNA